MSVVSLYPENKYNGNPINYAIDESTYTSVFILYKDSEKPLRVSSIVNNTKNYFVYLYYKSSYSEFGGNYFIIHKRLFQISDVQNKINSDKIVPSFNGIALVHEFNKYMLAQQKTLYTNFNPLFKYKNYTDLTHSFYYSEVSIKSTDYSSNNDRPYVIDLSNAQLSTDSSDKFSSGQVVTTLQPAPFKNSPSGTNNCYEFYNEQKDKIKKLGEERADLNFQVLKCTVDLQTLKRQIYDRYQNEVEVLKEKKRQLKEQYEKRKSIMDTFTYSSTEKVFLFIAILIDFVLIVVNVMLYKEY